MSIMYEAQPPREFYSRYGTDLYAFLLNFHIHTINNNGLAFLIGPPRAKRYLSNVMLNINAATKMCRVPFRTRKSGKYLY